MTMTKPPIETDFTRRCQKAMGDQSISLRALAKGTKMAHPYVADIVKGVRRGSPTARKRIADFLGVHDLRLTHIYPQAYEHDPAFLVGNTEALFALRSALDDLIAGRLNVAVVDLMATDGEGYDLIIQRDDSEWQGEAWRNLLRPYFPDSCDPPTQYLGRHPMDRPAVKDAYAKARLERKVGE